MQRSTIATVLLLTIAFPVTVLAATASDQEFRDCGRAAMDKREQHMINALAVFHGEWMAIQNERRVQLLEAWNNENDEVRRDRQSLIIRDRNRDRRDAEKRKNDEFRNAEREYRDDYKRCYDDFKSRERQRRDEERRRRDEERRNR